MCFFFSLRSRSESRREIGGKNEGAEVSSVHFSEIMACGISEKVRISVNL